MLEKRVTALEERLGRIETILTDLAPKITEIFHTCARQSDLAAVKTELAELKGKVSNLPTTWTMFVALITSAVAVAGLVLAIGKIIKL